MDTEAPPFNMPGFFSEAFEDNDPRNEAASRVRTTGPSSSSTGTTQTQSQSQPRPTGEERTCRICLDSSFAGEPADPELGRLFSPCKCTGTARYVHEECLKQWRIQSANQSSFYQCPTCKYKYKFGRMKFAQVVASSAMQIGLTVFILLVTVFVLGFVADPIINFYMDPGYYGMSALMPTGGFTIGGITFQTYSGGTYYRRNYPPPPPAAAATTAVNKRPIGWLEHMVRGITSLGLLGFIKALFIMPNFWFRMTFGGHGGGRRHGEGQRNQGRERLGYLTWVVVAWGVFNFLVWVWKKVRHTSRKFLSNVADSVLDISEDTNATRMPATAQPAQPPQPARPDRPAQPVFTTQPIQPTQRPQSAGTVESAEQAQRNPLSSQASQSPIEDDWETIEGDSRNSEKNKGILADEMTSESNLSSDDKETKVD